MDTRPAIKFVVVREETLFCHKMPFLSGRLMTGPECFMYVKLCRHSPKSAHAFPTNNDYRIHTCDNLACI